MLFAIPVIVVVGFGTYAIWHATADLDSVEESALAWPTIWQQIWRARQAHLRLGVLRGPHRGAARRPAHPRPRARPRRPVVVGFANAGQAAPSVGLIVLFAMWLGFGFRTAVIVLTLYAILPVLRNTIVGLQGVDPTLVEAGRGVGHVRALGAAPHRAAAGPAGDHGRRPHRAGAARRYGDPGDLHQRWRARRDPPGRDRPAPLLGHRLGRRPRGAARPAHRVARSRARAATSGRRGSEDVDTGSGSSPRLVAAALSLVLAACSLPTAGGFVPTGKLAGPLKDVKSAGRGEDRRRLEELLRERPARQDGDHPDAVGRRQRHRPDQHPGFSAAARQAMLDDQIQAMWEYTGTGWITYLGHDKPIPDEEKQYTAVRDEDLKKNESGLAQAGADEQHLRLRDHQEDRRQATRSTKLSDLKKVPVDRAHLLRRVRADQPARRAQGHAREVRRAAGRRQGRARGRTSRPSRPARSTTPPPRARATSARSSPPTAGSSRWT